MPLRNCDVCTEKYGVGDERNWHDPENWPQECMDHYRKRKGEDRIGLQVMKDIEPYRAVGLPGAPIISGRAQHRDQMRAHGMVEVGNEKVTKQYEAPPGLREDLKRAIYETDGSL